ncbi:hypothetical protein GCM10027406_04990 [Leifsonia lichenia]
MRKAKRSFLGKVTSGALAALIVLAMVPLTASPAAAEGQSQLSLTKTASATTVTPGETFSYTLEVGCTAVDVGTGCTNATLVDTVPAQFEVVGVSVGAGLSAQTPTVAGNTVTVVFDSPLDDPPGAIGLPASATGTVTISVRVRDDLPYEDSGVPIDNTGDLTATNQLAPATSTATVTPDIPLDLATTATKSFDPTGAPADPGTTTTVTLGGTNTSNAGVDSIVLTDPGDPTATPNPFTYLAFSSFGAVTFPPPADQVQVDVSNGTEWSNGTPGPTPTLPTGIDPSLIKGIRFTFTNSTGEPIPPGSTGSVDVVLVQRPDVADLTTATVVSNDVQSTVVHGTDTANGTSSADYTIQSSVVTVDATKSFDPTTVVEGLPSTATIGATNNSAVPLTELTLTEPTQTGADPFAGGFPAGITFGGFTGDVTWPAGATGVSVHYYYTDGTDETLSSTTTDTIPAPDASKSVTRFSVTFTGEMPPSASASIPFVLDTDPNITNDSLTLTNSQTATGTSASGSTGTDVATADLTILTKRLATTIGKVISPTDIASSPGEYVTVQLPAGTSPSPASTVDATTIVVQDPPGDPPTQTDWWNHFNATAITQTAVPAGASLTIQYWDGTEWVDLPGAVGIQGPTTPPAFSMDIPANLQDDIQGLRFVYTDPNGFPPGASVQPNVTMSLRDELRDGSGPATGTDETIENCAESSATGVGGETADTVMPSPCPVVNTHAGGLPGGDDFLDKSWAAPKVLTARSDAQTTATLNWSTGGRSNLSSMVISDAADPTTTPVSLSVFNAFDLIGVPAITAAQDPLLKYDQVTGVELYNGTGWVDAANDPCPAACIGSFPGVTLTAGEQASTVGVRLTYVESPDRAAVSIGDPTAPPVGSGVARSTGNTRGIVLTFRLRDDVRSPVTTPDPVIATRVYNSDLPGEIVNTARATGTSAVDGTTVTDTAEDIVRLLDVPLNASLTKSWEGGPLGVPELGTDPAFYPSGRVTLTGTNTTASNVDNLAIEDPASGTPTPFNVFDLVAIESVSVPSGATSSTVELTRVAQNGPPVTTGYSIADALALTASELADVIGIRVIHSGRIDAGAASVVVFDTRLRATMRTDGSPVTAAADSPVQNTAEATVSDEGGAVGGIPTVRASDSIDLVDGELTVTAGKTITPAQQTEPDDSAVTVALSGEPGGSIRARRLTLTDESGTFWNAFDFRGFATPLVLTAPIDRVQIDACVDRTWADPTATCEADGGHWELGVRQTEADANATPLPAGVTDADVDGIRFVFTRVDGSLFEPVPRQDVAVSAQRRADLRSGGPVPSDLSTNSPAPGETAAGTFTNTVDALAEGTFDNGGAPFTAEDSATATETYVHATSAVAVTKSPAGSQVPGALIPYTLTVTNTGAIAVTDPVITDQLPTDADGPLLVFDPFADPTSSPYSYALAGAAPVPPSGPAMPTDPASVSASVSQAGARIQFAFPPGTVLEVGQTYTITIALMFRPGLPAGTNVTNTVGVTGDRPFDGCTAVLDPATGACTATTTVTVESAGALRGVKSVRATDPELGVETTVPGVTCTPSDDGFYAGPCVPITKPGGTEVWRLTLVNTGTLPMDRMIAIDKLPTPGDTGVLTPLPRNSEFRPTYTGTSTLAQAPAGAVLTEYYTTDATPCVDDLSTTGVACPPGAWTLWSAGVDPTTVTALKFVVAFDPAIAPADSISIDVTTRTPAVPPAATTDPVAWNTVGVAGRVNPNGVPAVTAQTEGNKVGVALATGSVSIVKQVTGDGADFAPATFTGELQCVSAGVTLDPIPVTLMPGTPTTVDDLPWGADCTVVEDDAGQASSTATHVTVATEGDPVPVITVVNTYDLAGLVVVKHVDSTAVDQNGDPIPYGPFPVTVDCTYLGAPVYATGYSAADPMAADLADGGSLTLTGLPAGASCVVTETDAMGAVTTSVTTTTAEGTTGPTTGDSATVELTPDAAGGSTNTVTVTNGYDVGSLRLLKVVDGAGAPDFGAGPFLFHITCTLDDASGTRTTWNGNVVLGGSRPLESTIGDIATGSVCDVTEPGQGGANGSAVSPGEVTIGSGGIVTVTATNTFLAGAIHVDKERDGAGADRYGSGPFTVVLTCLRIVDGVPAAVPIPGGPSRTLDSANGYAADYLLLPAGASCVLRETGTGGATGHTILDANGDQTGPVTVVAGETVTLTAVNTFAVGSIRVTKLVDGGGATERGGGPFTVHLVCTALTDGLAAPVVIPGGADRTLSAANDLTAEYAELPTGASCELTETADGGADATSITPNSGDASVGTVTVGDGDTVDVTVTNTFDPAASGLSDTGTDVWPLLLAGLGLVGIGALVTRRRRPAPTESSGKDNA